MEKYGFVYIWFDSKRKMYYIGCHWGTKDDGYICSSTRMRNVYRRRPQDFKRRILTLVYTNKNDLYEEEHRWFSLIKDKELGKKYYNLRKHKWGHWSSDVSSKLTVSEKIKEHHKSEEFRKLASENKLGNKNPMKRVDVIKKRLKTWKSNNHIIWNKGVKTGPNPKHSERMKGRIPGNKGIPMSDENKNKISKKWLIIEPDGKEVIIMNLNKYCKEKQQQGYKLHSSNLMKVANGFRASSQNFKCKRLDI